MSSIYIVTETEDYELINQFAYTNKEDALEKFNELTKQLFSEKLDEAKASGNYDDELRAKDCTDYQDSTAWWDDDCRVKVHFEEVILEERKNKYFVTSEDGDNHIVFSLNTYEIRQWITNHLDVSKHWKIEKVSYSQSEEQGVEE